MVVLVRTARQRPRPERPDREAGGWWQALRGRCRQSCAKALSVKEPIIGIPSLIRATQAEDAKHKDIITKERSVPVPLVFDASPLQVQGCQPEFRTKLLSRLCSSGAWMPRSQRPSPYQTVTIFDWDDTLFCTTHFGWYPDCSKRDTEMRALASSVRKLLEAALIRGQTFIITNARKEWVEYTAKRFMPGLIPALKRVRIISARDRFELEFPGDPAEWKFQACLDIHSQLDPGAVANILALGDSPWDLDSARRFGRALPRAVVKTVKFCEKPSAEHLHRQQTMVLGKFQQLVNCTPTSTSGGETRFAER